MTAEKLEEFFFFPPLATQGPILTWQLALLVGVVALYLAVPPGAAAGFLDFYVLSPLSRQRFKRQYKPSDYTLLAKLGEGSFGVVYRALEAPNNEEVVVKICDDYGEEEAWMSERMWRHDPSACACLRATFMGPSTSAVRRSSNGSIRNGDENNTRWICWDYEGPYTLSRLRQEKNFPYNLEPFLFRNSELKSIGYGSRRKFEIFRELTRQVARCLASFHSTGIVHRDVKPSNIIFSTRDGCAKLIDLGGCADLRTGRNYNPSEYLMDPRCLFEWCLHFRPIFPLQWVWVLSVHLLACRYAAPGVSLPSQQQAPNGVTHSPCQCLTRTNWNGCFVRAEQYAMPRTTPIAPPTPLAILLSPVLWTCALYSFLLPGF